MTEPVTLSARAKVNLFLRILSRESGGYHNLETVYCLIELADHLTVTRTTSAGVTLSVAGADVGPDQDNLAYRAATVILETIGKPFGVEIRLEKNIPAKAGLGGASSDAAATLRAVNNLAGDTVPRHELIQLGAKLGSDVSFFLSGESLALAWGRGERLFALPAPNPVPALLVIPEFGVSTPKAYALLDAAGPHHPRGAVILNGDAFRTWGGIGRLGGNDFESVIFGQHPDLREIFEKVAETHPLLVRMSGSGSAIFGLYRNEPGRDGAAEILGKRFGTVIKTRTI